MLTLSLGMASECEAQGRLAGLLGDGSPPQTQLVEPGPLIDRALASFLQEAQRQVAREQTEQEAELPQAADIVETMTRAFEEAARVRLDELTGDGALTLAEATDALGRLREQYLGDLHSHLEAARDDAEPPPLAGPDESPEEYARRLALYTFFVRNPGWVWLIVVGLTLGGVVLAGIIAFLTRKAVSNLAKLRYGSLAAEMTATLSGPLYLGLGVAGVAASLYWVWVPYQAEAFIRNTLAALFLISGFWLLWNACGVVGSTVRLITARAPQSADEGQVDLIRKGLRLILIVAGMMFGSELLLGTEMITAMAGVGLLALALTLAAQDTLRNMFGWVTISIDRPFHVGQYLQYQDHFGEVKQIGFRGTRLRTLDGHLVTIPNSELIKSAIDNVGARPSIRRRFRIDIEYDTPPDKVREAVDIVRQVLDGREWVPEDQPPEVAFDEFGEHSLQLLVQYYHAPPHYWEAKARDQEVNLAILERFAEAGVRFAYPTRALVHRGDGDLPLTVQVVGSVAPDDAGEDASD